MEGFNVLSTVVDDSTTQAISRGAKKAETDATRGAVLLQTTETRIRGPFERWEVDVVQLLVNRN